MIEKHRACLRALSDDSLDVVVEVTQCGGVFVIDALEERNMVQADVVMALLAARTRGDSPRATAALQELTRLHVVKPVHPWPKPLPPVPPPRTEVITAMKRNLRLKRIHPDHGNERTEALRVRLGMTRKDLLQAGVCPEDITVAARLGQITWGQP